MDLLHQIFKGGREFSKISGSEPVLNRWRVDFLKRKSKINKKCRDCISPPKLISFTVFCLVFLKRSEYKVCWAHKPYFSHVHRILGAITRSNKCLCLFSNDFRKCIQVSQKIQWILLQDIQCRHFSNTKNFWDGRSQLKHALLVDKMQWAHISQPSF